MPRLPAHPAYPCQPDVRVRKFRLTGPARYPIHAGMKTRNLYPIASPWLIPDGRDEAAEKLVGLCDGRRTIGQVARQLERAGMRSGETLVLGERLGVIALATGEMPFLNTLCAETWGGLLFEGAKIRGVSPSAHLADLKTHYRELSRYLQVPPEEIHRLFHASFAGDAPGNVGRAASNPGRLLRAVWRRYESDAYLARRHLIHFHGLTSGLLFSRAVARLRSLRGGRPAIRLLDAGCGDGVLMRRVFQAFGRNCRVFGVDIGWNVLKFARFVDRERGARSGDVLRGDAERLPFRQGAFDLVCCFEVLEHLPSPESALEAFHRVLTPGGALLASWSSGTNLMSGHVSAAGPEQVRKTLESARFRVERLEYLTGAQTTFVEARRLRAAAIPRR